MADTKKAGTDARAGSKKQHRTSKLYRAVLWMAEHRSRISCDSCKAVGVRGLV